MKALGGLTLVSVLVVMVIVMATGQQQATHLFGHGQGNLSIQQGENSPLQTAFKVQIDQKLSQVVTSAHLSFTSSGSQSIDPGQTLADINQDNPDIPLNKKIASGGVMLFFPGQSTKIIVCTKAGAIYRCLATNFANGSHASADGPLLRLARERAAHTAGF